jgi:hypothetical protein
MADRRPPVDPWAHTAPAPPSTHPPPPTHVSPRPGADHHPGPDFRPGKAPIRVPEPATTLADSTQAGRIPAYGSAGVPIRVPRAPLRYQMRQLKRGWEWSGIGALFAFVSWGIWALSQRSSMVGPIIAFVLVMIVAVGVFALSRLLGKLILERWLGRLRRSAWAAHLATGAFLAVAGVQYLRSVEWITDGLSWLTGLS